MSGSKTIYDLLGSQDQAYDEKMNHPIPPTRVVEREIYILGKVKDKVVLDIGATGPMHDAIKELAAKCFSIDIIEKAEENYFQIDLDHTDHLPMIEKIDMIIAGEVIEHLSNPGHFLDLMKPYACPILLTTPNAFSEVARQAVLKGIEQVNKEHVCYFSYHTLTVLLTRHGYKIDEWFWYKGKPNTAEGLICLIS